MSTANPPGKDSPDGPGGSAGEPGPPPFGSGGGGSGGPEAMDRFLEEFRGLLDDVESFLAEREVGGEAQRAFADVAARSLSGLRSEVDRFQEMAPSQGASVQTTEAVLAVSNATPLLTAQRTSASQAEVEAARAEALQTGLAISETVFKKIALWLPDGPWKSGVQDIAELIALTGKLTSGTGDQIKRIEQKVASLQESINGRSFPKGEIRGPVSGGKPSLRAEVEELETKIERFFESVVGTPVPRKDDGSVDEDPVDQVEFPAIRGSVLWMAWDLERKLEHVFGRLVGEEYPRGIDGNVTAPVSVRPERSVEGTLDELRTKIDTLAKLLGKTLYDVEWNVEPGPSGGMRTVPRGARPENETPPRSIKDELHDLERQMGEVLRLLRIIIRILRSGYPPPPENGDDDGNGGHDGDDHEVPVLPVDLKRIFVWEEGTFQAASASDELEVQIRTEAFDLAGWIDLTELADGDEVEVELWVRLPGNLRRLYRSATYRDAGDAGLRALYDVVGEGPVVGSGVDVVVRQTASASGYAPPLSIAYQLVVESR